MLWKVAETVNVDEGVHVRHLVIRALIVGVPLTIIGAAFTWDALHPEAVLLLVLLTPAIILKYLNVVPMPLFLLVFVVLQTVYYLVLVLIFDLFRKPKG
jgi:hypothetical protein